MNILPEFTPDPNSRHSTLSGIEKAVTNPSDTRASDDFQYQVFFLPSDFKRRDVIPELTGLQICATIDDAEEFVANFTLEIREFGQWVLLDSGSVIRSHTDGTHVWVTAYFNKPIPVSEGRLQSEFRFGVQTSSLIWININTDDQETILYRILASTADSGTDFLGNSYRSVVIPNNIGTVNTHTTESNSFWLSKPNPSKFAVESLYFDISDIEKPTVVDRILLDPITPGVHFNVYYSSEGEPGLNDQEWENKLWNPVYQDFKAEKRQEHLLREPIAARYVKIEFTHLQAQHYQPGTFHQAIKYKKHPKWVLEYFMQKIDAVKNTDDVSVARNVKVVLDGLSLAYDYYLDDLVDEIKVPTHDEVIKFIDTKNDKSDQVDEETLNRINSTMQAFTISPAEKVRSVDSMLSAFVEATKDFAYPVEKITRAKADVTPVSSLDRMDLIIENQMPVMFFYLTCRHAYREQLANFENDRAYFVGIRELALTREHYTVASDTDMYVEPLGDGTNLFRNDWVVEDSVNPKSSVPTFSTSRAFNNPGTTQGAFALDNRIPQVPAAGLTLMGWAKMLTATDQGEVISIGSGTTDHHFNIHIIPNNYCAVNLNWGSGMPHTLYNYAATEVPFGQWNHYAAVIDPVSNKLFMYFNGGNRVESEMWFVDILEDGPEGLDRVSVGADWGTHQDGGGHFYQGVGYHPGMPAAISHVGVYARALTSTEILAAYNGKTPIHATNFWKMHGEATTLEPNSVAGSPALTIPFGSTIHNTHPNIEN